MKKIFTAVALVVSAYGFSANCVEENVKLKNVENTFTQSVSYDEFFGTCHIVIKDLETGEIVEDVILIANSAEACEQMLEDTLKALEKKLEKGN